MRAPCCLIVSLTPRERTTAVAVENYVASFRFRYMKELSCIDKPLVRTKWLHFAKSGPSYSKSSNFPEFLPVFVVILLNMASNCD